MTMPRPIATTLLTASIAGLTLTSAGAQELEFWGASDYWEVAIDPTLNDGCLIHSEFTDGTYVRIGFDRLYGGGYVTAFNYAWGNIEEGAWYDITFYLDQNGYDGEAQGIYWGDVPGAEIAFDNEDFLFDIAKKYTMTLVAEGEEVLSIDLTGSYRALEAAVACQEEMG